MEISDQHSMSTTQQKSTAKIGICPALAGVVFPIAAILVLIFFSSALAQPPELTLEECYRLALEQSESLKQNKERIEAAEQRYQQAISEVFPKVHALANQRIRDSNEFGIYSSSDSDPEGFRSTPNRKHPFDTSISVSQPLFNGFRDFLLAEAAEAEKKALSFQDNRASEILYLDVTELFLQSKFYEKDLVLLDRAEKVLRERVSDLNKFIELGKSRESEIIAAQSDIADLLASRERIRKLHLTSLESLAFLIGRSAAEIDLADKSTEPVIASLDHYVAMLNERDDLMAAQELVVSAEKQVTAAERLRWPNLYLDGNYYPYEDPEQNREWEVMFQLDIPLYEGGGLIAQAKEQEALLREQKLEVQKLRRESERDLRVAYNEFKSSGQEVEKLKELADTTKRNFAAQREDYKNGVVTNLEVLQAIRQGLEAERRLLAARTEVSLNAARLLVAAGAVS